MDTIKITTLINKYLGEVYSGYANVPILLKVLSAHLNIYLQTLPGIMMTEVLSWRFSNSSFLIHLLFGIVL